MLQFQLGGDRGAQVMPQHSMVAGLGVKPAIPGGSLLIQQGPQVTTAPEVSGTTAQNVCTSDQRLVYSGGAWRVRSVDNAACSGGVIPDESASYVAQSGQPVFVGPFLINPKNNAGQITTIDQPSQIGSDWGAWLTAALNSIGAAKVAAGHHMPAYAAKTIIPSLLPRVVGATVDFVDNGTPQGAPFTTNPDGTPAPPFAPVPVAYASGGHALHPSKAWFDNDDAGFRITRVQYDSDPNTYSYYSLAQWLGALSPAMTSGGVGWLMDYDYLTPGNTTTFNRNGDVPPIARFKYPWTACAGAGSAASGVCTPDDWGLWVTVAPMSGNLSSTQPADGDWDTGLDGPAAHVMQVGMAPIPQEGLWDDILDAIEWIPYALGTLLFDVAGWLSQFLCDVSKIPIMQAQLPKDPATRGAAMVALAAASVGCMRPVQIDCTTPYNAANVPSCATSVAAVVPWYKRWYVVAGALALGGIVAINAFSSPAKPAPAAAP